MGDVTYEPEGGTYFHATLDEEICVLIFINLHDIEAVFESHIACFADIILPQALCQYCNLTAENNIKHDMIND